MLPLPMRFLCSLPKELGYHWPTDAWTASGSHTASSHQDHCPSVGIILSQGTHKSHVLVLMVTHSHLSAFSSLAFPEQERPRRLRPSTVLYIQRARADRLCLLKEEGKCVHVVGGIKGHREKLSPLLLSWCGVYMMVGGKTQTLVGGSGSSSYICKFPVLGVHDAPSG